MLVSNNSLLNILLPNDNKVLKDVLKQADSKTLQQMVNNKSVSVNDVLKNLFDQVKNGEKSNSNIENILKNSNMFKDLGSVSKSLSSILNQLDSNSNLDKYKPVLQAFLKDIKNLDANVLKEQIKNTGVFLESKISQQAMGKNLNLPANITKLLTQIQTIIKDIQSPLAKQINQQVSNFLQTPDKADLASVKNLLTSLQNLSTSLGGKETQNLSNLTNQLKSMMSNASLIESKAENNTQSLLKNQAASTPSTQQNIKEIVTQLKSAIINNPKQIDVKNTLANIDNIIKPNQPITKEAINKLINLSEVKQLASQNPAVNNQVSKLQNMISVPKEASNPQVSQQIQQQLGTAKEQINTQTKQLLTQIKTEVLSNPKNIEAKNILPQIDNLLKSNDLFVKNETMLEPKALLNKLINSPEIKQASVQSNNISNLVLNLKNVSENITTLENKALNLQNITSEKSTLLTNLKENLNSLKNELLNVKNVDTKAVSQIITKLENIQNIFTKVEVPINNLQQNTQQAIVQNNNVTTFQNNFSNNLSNLLLSLKENITNLSTNQNNLNTQNQVLNIVDKIETVVKENLANPNQNILGNLNTKTEANPLNNDMKSVLLQMQEELATKTDVKSQEMFKQIDKMLMQIDYHQLLSFTANSDYVYVPFLWDMMEDGTINMKKTDEDKFYCQINLTLKDFGKVDLMLALYDKNKIDITIKAQREHFKLAVRDNIQKLKQNLNNVDLIPVNIKLLDLEEDNPVQEKTAQVYENNYASALDSTVDIRI